MKVKINSWIRNLHQTKRKSPIATAPEKVIAQMLLQKIWGSLILKAAKYISFIHISVIHIFLLHFSKSLHLHMDNMATFSYTMKIGKVQNNTLAYQTKQIQDYSVSKGIINIIECLLHICELTHIELGATHILPENIFCLISPAFVLCHSR